MALAAAWLPLIDLRAQHGVHPRIGALDVCPFVGDVDVPAVAERFWREFGVPVILYEQSAGGRTLPDVRRGLYAPDFGSTPHPQWGVTVMGRRSFLIALNLNLPTDDVAIARRISGAIRREREMGNPRFAGVRALGFRLKSQGKTQVSMNLTQPDETPIDPILDWIEREAGMTGEPELIGVIRTRDLVGASRLTIAPKQIADTDF
jgi:glutamate formiminotransferase